MHGRAIYTQNFGSPEVTEINHDDVMSPTYQNRRMRETHDGCVFRSNPFTSKIDHISNFASNLTRYVHPHSMENFASHSLPRWKMIILSILTIPRSYSSLSKVGRIFFLNLHSHSSNPHVNVSLGFPVLSIYTASASSSITFLCASWPYKGPFTQAILMRLCIQNLPQPTRNGFFVVSKARVVQYWRLVSTRKANLSFRTSRTVRLMYSRVVVDPCISLETLRTFSAQRTWEGPVTGCRLVRVVRVV